MYQTRGYPIDLELRRSRRAREGVLRRLASRLRGLPWTLRASC